MTSAQEVQFSASDYSDEVSDQWKILRAAENNLNHNRYKEAKEYIFQAKNIAQTSDSENFRAYTSILLAAFYRGLELNNKASESIETAIRSLSSIKNSKEKNKTEARLLLEKGLLNFAVSKDEEGKLNLWKSKTKFQKLDQSDMVSTSLQSIYSKLGEYYLSRKKMDSAKYYFGQNLKLSNHFPSIKDLELNAKYGLSRFYLSKNQPDSALYYLSAIENDLPQVKDVLLKRDIYKNMAQVHYAVGDLEHYKTFNERYLKLNDSIYDLHKETRISLANEAENHDGENPESDMLIWVILTIGVALTGLGWAYNYHRKVKKEYAKFQKIMQNLNEQESTSFNLTEKQDASVDNLYVISEKTEQIILDKLEKFEKEEKYINPKVSLQFLAKTLDTNTKYLSEIINKKKGQNFNNYINELRIHYIIRKLKSEPKYQNYKVSSLAEECGFNSRNTFTLAFKNTLGISPANFIGFMKKEEAVF